MELKMLQDNVLVALEPPPMQSVGGIDLVFGVKPKRGNGHKAQRGKRTATVLRVGPGYYGPPTYQHPGGLFHPCELKPGDRVILDEIAGQDWRGDLSAVRQNVGQEFDCVCGIRAEFRIIREQEALAVVEARAVIT